MCSSRFKARYAQLAPLPSFDGMLGCKQADLPHEFTLDDLRMSEIDLLQQLDWRVLLISPHSFLEVFKSVLSLEKEPKFNAERAAFIIDMSCYVCDALAYPESIIAAAAALCSWPCDERAQASCCNDEPQPVPFLSCTVLVEASSAADQRLLCDCC